jgi:hypothetical protein
MVLRYPLSLSMRALLRPFAVPLAALPSVLLLLPAGTAANYMHALSPALSHPYSSTALGPTAGPHETLFSPFFFFLCRLSRFASLALVLVP